MTANKSKRPATRAGVPRKVLLQTAGWKRLAVEGPGDEEVEVAPEDEGGFWARDLGPKQIARNESTSRAALTRVPGIAGFALTNRRPKPLTGLLEGAYAARERAWYVRTAGGLARAHLRRCQRRGIQVRAFALTVTPYRWMIEPDRLDPRYIRDLLSKWRKQTQRWAKALPPNSFVTGLIEVSLNYDEKYGFYHWAFHLHLLVHVTCSSKLLGKAAIRRAFPVKANEALGATSPFRCTEITLARGGQQGWLRYLSKGLQVHAVHRRWVGYNEDKGTRRSSVKRSLRTRELAPWAAVALDLKASDLMIWVGYRRYGDEVVRL